MEGSSRAQYYRDKAKRLREMAAHMKLPLARHELEDIAAQYEMLAETVESLPENQNARNPN